MCYICLLYTSESELMNKYDLSRITVRNACNHLVKEGILYRVAGKGTFVSSPKIMTSSLAYMGFREQLERMGYETDVYKRQIFQFYDFSVIFACIP